MVSPSHPGPTFSLRFCPYCPIPENPEDHATGYIHLLLEQLPLQLNLTGDVTELRSGCLSLDSLYSRGKR